MATDTNTTFEARSRRVATSSIPQRGTSNENDTRADTGSYLRTRPAPSKTNDTQGRWADFFVVKKAGESGKLEENRPLDENNLRLPGTILEIDEATVLCELNTRDGHKHIRFQRSLFPDNIRYGVSIWIGIDESSGIRRPVVQERHPDLNDQRLLDENTEMNDLINRF